jgi:hypothetical protein
MRASRVVILAALTVLVVLVCGCAVSPAASGGAGQAKPASCTAARGTWAAAEPASPGSMNNDLTSVTSLAAGDAWAVGSYANGSGGQTLVEHWTGTTWSVGSPAGAWAVGQFSAIGADDAFAVRYCAPQSGQKL